jgi:hypothetical protein
MILMHHDDAKRLIVDLRSGHGFIKANIDLHRTFDHVIVRKSPTFGENNLDDDDDLLKSLEHVAKMENLTRLDLGDFEGNNNNVPVKGLTLVMMHAHKLETLRLDTVRMVGSDEDFGKFLKALSRHSALTQLHLVGCLFSKENPTMIQALAETLSSLKTLRVVGIVETRYSPCEYWTEKALTALLSQSSSLTALHIRAFQFLRDDHIVGMAQTLQRKKNNGVSCCCCLQELTLLSDIGDDAVLAICDMLRINQSLQILSLNRIIMNGEQGSELIADALAENSTLREIRLYFLYCVVHKLRASFLDLLVRKSNCTLEKIQGGWACSNMEFFLKLNRAGRKRLIGNKDYDGSSSSHWDWVEVMASLQDDLDALFYLLSQNPTLCCL